MAPRIGSVRGRRRFGRRTAVALALATGIGLAVGVAMARPPRAPRLLEGARHAGIAATIGARQRAGPPT